MSNPVVKIKQGEVRGFSVTSAEGKDYNIFLGIPYAEPPVGALRFKDPVPVKNWNGIRDATKEGGMAAQYDMFSNEYSGVDDCLYLNVYSPSTVSNDPLPVMINFHGGGLVQGSGNRDAFNPEFIVEKDIVVVSFNYRLGVMGFLCTDSINARGDMALKDQHLVLRWVQDNIGPFNGDRNNVTLFGSSAGAALIEYQMLAESSKNLFHKAITRSGSALNPWARSRNPITMAERLAKVFGYAPSSPESLFDFINKIDTERLVKASGFLCTSEEMKNSMFFAFTPVINELEGYDGFIKGEPADLFASGKFNKVPTISGVTDKEGIMMKFLYTFDDVKDILNKFNYFEMIPNFLNKNPTDLSERLGNVYKPQDDRDIVVDFLSDVCIFGGALFTLKQKIKHNPNDNYFYCFTYDGNMNLYKKMFKSTEKGACHGDDECYDNLTEIKHWKNATPKDIAVKSRQVDMWTNFARTGNPTPKQTDVIKETWTPSRYYDQFQYMELGEEMKMSKTLWPERQKLWDELYINI